jgi:DNA-binding transcriptional ArsR family regulator
MNEGPNISRIAALIGDPARANILIALMDGRALTITELAQSAGVTIQTASGHLTKLGDAALTVTEKQGRHRYVRLSGPDIAEVLEMLMGIAQRTGAVRIRVGPKDAALRTARLCYDHLAGERGVELLDLILKHDLIEGNAALHVTPAGRKFFTDFGVEMASLDANRRPVCRACLDWSERRHHLGGALGAALLNAFTNRGWAVRKAGRVVEFSQTGMKRFVEMVEVQCAN